MAHPTPKTQACAATGCRRSAAPPIHPKRLRLRPLTAALPASLRAGLALACAAFAAPPAFAQNSSEAGAPATQTVTVSGRGAANAASVAGFGDIPLSRSPFSAMVITTRQLQDAGIASLADLTLLDAGVTDAYNAPGYWNTLAVRGFTVDPRRNLRRDGLPIQGETVIPLGNKAALEVLKGTSGIQAGTSAPGGLINFVVARPSGTLRQAGLSFSQPGTVGASVDLGDSTGRDGDAGRVGWRLHASAERLDPQVRSARGERHLLAAAVAWQPAADQQWEAEFESSRQSQPSMPGFSLLGSRLPAASSIDPRRNLNNQAWSLPVVFTGQTGSLRHSRELGAGLRLVVHGMVQRAVTDDRIAFPYGCSSENDFTRYCSDGSFDLYDFRSEHEVRSSHALDAALQGTSRWGGLQHRWQAGVLVNRQQAHFGAQAFNWAGIGTIDGLTHVPPAPDAVDPNTNRDERSIEARLQDAITLSPDWQLWAGLRHTRLKRDSVRTDGSRPTAYRQALTTPWLALAWTPGRDDLVYASAGQGMESEVVPNRPSQYTNAGEALPALKSRQIELGWKRRSPGLDWQIAAFDIRRPVAADIGNRRQIDGAQRHTGLEAEAEWRSGPFSLRASATALRARREGSADPGINGLKPTNVPGRSLKVQAAYNLRQVPGLALLGFVTHEGQRMVLPDNSVATPGWTRLDIGLRYRHRIGGQSLTWRLGLDNLADTRAWKEAPYQFDHAYLYPLAPRSLHGSVQIGF